VFDILVLILYVKMLFFKLKNNIVKLENK